jgi:hypothetical protein
MRISLIDFPLDELMDVFKNAPVIPYDIRQLKRKVSVVPLRSDSTLSEMDLRFLFDYNIFPPTIMAYRTQWQLEKREMRTGDVIVQQVSLPPSRWSLKIAFGVRVCEVISEATQRGFVYETLAGHAEKGRSSFTVETTGSGVIFRIETYSTPGNAVSKWLSRIFTVPYQSYCTRRALEHVRHQVDRSSTTG